MACAAPGCALAATLYDATADAWWCDAHLLIIAQALAFVRADLVAAQPPRPAAALSLWDGLEATAALQAIPGADVTFLRAYCAIYQAATTPRRHERVERLRQGLHAAAIHTGDAPGMA